MKKGGVQREISQSNALQKYRSSVVGRKGLVDLLVYEFGVTVICCIPGRVGVTTRQVFLPLLFDRFGHKVFCKRDVAFRRPYLIRVGNNVTLENGVTLDVKSDDGFIEIKDDVHLGRNTILSCLGGNMIIGKGTHIGDNCRLGSFTGLEIGENVRINNSTCIVGAGHAYDSKDIPIIQQPLTCKGPTRIADNVTLEEKVTLLDGVHVGSSAKIKAHSLVNKDVVSGCTLSGVPALPV